MVEIEGIVTEIVFNNESNGFQPRQGRQEAADGGGVYALPIPR